MKQILIDSNYLCWASHFKLRGLRVETEEGVIPTGAIFGFLRQILSLGQEFKSNQFYFCFDGLGNIRKDIFKGYKAGRDKDGDDYKEVTEQILLLKNEILPALGFENIYVQDGYEADDILAKIVQQFEGEEELVIVSGDEDLFQLLGPSVVQYIPTKKLLYTEKAFRKEYGIAPATWADFKAIAGCSSDKIPGIVGMGPKKTGELLKMSKWERLLDEENLVIYKKFLKLTKLPIPGTKEVQFWEDNLGFPSFVAVCEEYQFDSLLIHDSEDYERFIEGDFSSAKERVSKSLSRGRRKGLLYGKD